MITIVNYGLGNISAFSNMFKRMGTLTRTATNAEELAEATHIILPGVGAFDHAMQLLHSSGMRSTLDELVLERKVPVLGVCVGMQILADSSDEGRDRGLGWIKGHVRNLASEPCSARLPLPHMGWNDVEPASEEPLFKGLKGDARFYFLHSFYLDCIDPQDVAATAHYGFDFGCAVQHGNVYGIQFHPEKSHRRGAALLKNFAEV